MNHIWTTVSPHHVTNEFEMHLDEKLRYSSTIIMECTSFESESLPWGKAVLRGEYE